MSPARLPVIFLAFANDKEQRGRYLQNITSEKNSIESALSRIDGNLCEVIIYTDVSIKKIWDVFQSEKYRDRICIFHFGGHADGFQLLFESWNGEHEIALGDGLVSFLAKQKSLQLIFLNGCSTEKLVRQLTSKGIPAAIGTTHSIYDSLAAELAPSFYRALSEGVPLHRAWTEAIDQLNTKTSSRGEVRGFGRIDEKAEIGSEWFMEFGKGAEITKYWNLPDASRSPLWGLELPSKYYLRLPNAPYKGLERYSESDAGIFFGRGTEIRRLFDQVRGIYPVILLFGQSGIGKSSLLDAGLLPRIKEYFSPLYIRRKQERGLHYMIENVLEVELEKLGTQAKQPTEKQDDTIALLKKEFELLSSTESVEPETVNRIDLLLNKMVGAGKASSLSDRWKLVQENSINAKPLLVILDQVEEAFTKPMASLSPEEEVKQLCSQIKELYEHDELLGGKLILSFRKEYVAEIEATFIEYRIPYDKYLLQPMNHDSVVEVVDGISSNLHTSQKYQVTVEPDLSRFIADRIFENREVNDEYQGPVAPVLQLLMKKMWEKVQDLEDSDFTKSLYAKVGGRGWLIDYLKEVIESIHRSSDCTEIVDSGLLIDLLGTFVTPENTSAQIEEAIVLMTLYPSVDQDRLFGILEKLQFHQILFASKEGDKAWLRLMHDSLAPIIRNILELSDLPVQSISRSLANHTRNQTLLSANEVVFYDAWEKWYQKLSDGEEALIRRSRQRHIKPLLKQKLMSGGVNNQNLDLIDSFLSTSENEGLYFQFLLNKSKWEDLHREYLSGIVDYGDYKMESQLISRDLLNIINSSAVITTNSAYAMMRELKIKWLLETANVEELLNNLEIFLKHAGEDQLLDELGIIQLSYLELLKEQQIGVTPKRTFALFESRTIHSIVRLCQQIDEIYGLNIFNHLPTIDSPERLEVDLLPETAKFPADCIDSVEEIQRYTDKIRSKIQQDEIETALLQSLDLANKIAIDQEGVAKLIESYSLFKTKVKLGILSRAERDLERNIIAFDLLELSSQFISAFSPEKGQVSSDDIPRKLNTLDEILEIIRVELQVNNHDQSLAFTIITQLAPLLGYGAGWQICWYISLCHLAVIGEGSSAMFYSSLADFMKANRAFLPTEESAIIKSDIFRVILRPIFRALLEAGKLDLIDTLFPYFLLYLEEKEKHQKKFEDLSEYYQINKMRSIAGLLKGSEASSQDNRISLGSYYLSQQLELNNDKELIQSIIGNTHDRASISTFINELSGNSDQHTLEVFHQWMRMNVRWDTLEEFLDYIQECRTLLGKELWVGYYDILRLVLNEFYQFLNEKKSFNSSNHNELRRLAFASFQHNKFEQVLEILYSNRKHQEVIIESPAELYEELIGMRFIEVFQGNTQAVEGFKIKLLDYIERLYKVNEDPILNTLTEEEIDELNEKFIRFYANVGQSDVLRISDFEMLECVFPRVYRRILLCLSELNALNKSELAGLISSWRSKTDQLVELKKRMFIIQKELNSLLVGKFTSLN